MANNNTSNGIGFGTVLFLVFLVLKLTDNIDWSWWWVISPLWIPIALIIAIGGIGALILISRHK
jgi:ABC-type antimicrobial peptide transport system permease subunit